MHKRMDIVVVDFDNCWIGIIEIKRIGTGQAEYQVMAYEDLVKRFCRGDGHVECPKLQVDRGVTCLPVTSTKGRPVRRQAMLDEWMTRNQSQLKLPLEQWSFKVIVLYFATEPGRFVRPSQVSARALVRTAL
jgi:hypothetical protein